MPRHRIGLRLLQSSSLVVTARVLTRSAPGLLALLALLTLANVCGAVITMVATGVLVGAVPQWVSAGSRSGAPGRAAAAFTLIVALNIMAYAMSPAAQALADSLASRFRVYVRHRTLAAVLAPQGIAHLEDPSFLQRLERAKGLGVQERMEPLVVRAWWEAASLRLTGLAAALLLARFRWWAPLLLVGAETLNRIWFSQGAATQMQYMDHASFELRRSAYFRDLLFGTGPAKEIQLFGAAPWLLSRFAQHWLNGMRQAWSRRAKGQGMMVANLGGLAFAYGTVFAVLGLQSAQGEFGVDKLVLFLQAAFFTGGGFSYLGQWEWVLRYGARPAAHALALPAPRKPLAPADRPRDLPEDWSRITLDRVRFRYPTSDRDVLRGIDLEIIKGHSLAIVGENGAGKTTLVKLLCRLYEPNGGRIRVDQTDLREVDVLAWRQQVAVVFQDFSRFELDARANVGFGCAALAHDDEALDEAARLAGALEIVRRLPSGWDTPLSRAYAGGTDLSAGEWQRVALARALLALRCGAQLLILDEPTASLDVRAEAEIFGQILEVTEDVATILISHRFSTVRRADRICVLHEGRIAEEGSHDELIALGGLYARMFALQAEPFRGASRG